MLNRVKRGDYSQKQVFWKGVDSGANNRSGGVYSTLFDEGRFSDKGNAGNKSFLMKWGNELYSQRAQARDRLAKGYRET